MVVWSKNTRSAFLWQLTSLSFVGELGSSLMWFPVRGFWGEEWKLGEEYGFAPWSRRLLESALVLCSQCSTSLWWNSSVYTTWRNLRFWFLMNNSVLVCPFSGQCKITSYFTKMIAKNCFLWKLILFLWRKL